MRIDPSHLGDQIRKLSGGGAADAARGNKATETTRSLQGEMKYEAMDRLLLKQLAVQTAAEAAGSAVSFADAKALADRTAQLAGKDSTAARIAQGQPDSGRLRNLLGE